MKKRARPESRGFPFKSLRPKPVPKEGSSVKTIKSILYINPIHKTLDSRDFPTSQQHKSKPKHFRLNTLHKKQTGGVLVQNGLPST
jgi:hypothetical protein